METQFDSVPETGKEATGHFSGHVPPSKARGLWPVAGPGMSTGQRLGGIANGSPSVKRLQALQQSANNSPQVSNATGNRPPVAAHVGTVQLMPWPKKAKDQPSAKDTTWEGHERELYEWCNDKAEYQYWVEERDYGLWKAMADKGEDAHDKSNVESFVKFQSGGKAETPQKPKKTKAKPVQETEEERQVRIGVENEERMKREAAERAQARAAEFDQTDYTAVTGILNANPIAKSAWDVAVKHFKSASTQGNISRGGTESYEDLEDALAVWAQAAGEAKGLGVIKSMSTFKEVQDKSQRADGGKNTANLVERKYQADFILRTKYLDINVHIDSKPPK